MFACEKGDEGEWFSFQFCKNYSQFSTTLSQPQQRDGAAHPVSRPAGSSQPWHQGRGGQCWVTFNCASVGLSVTNPSLPPDPMLLGIVRHLLGVWLAQTPFAEYTGKHLV